MQEGELEKCLKGDKNALKQFYESHIDLIFRLCLRILGDRERAKDAVQETFFKAFSNLNKFRNQAEITTWLYRIATNVCLDMVRRSAAKVVSLDTEEWATAADFRLCKKFLPDRSPIEEVVRKLLSKMKRQWAETFWYFTIHQLDQKEIARIQNISVATVKMRLSKIREILRTKLRDREL